MEIYEDNTEFIDSANDEMLREWTNGVPFNSGMFAGVLDRIILDGVPSMANKSKSDSNDSQSNSEESSTLDTLRDNTAPALFTAGWFFAFQEEDLRQEILGCFNENEELTNLFFDSMDSYIVGARKIGDEKMESTKPLLE